MKVHRSQHQPVVAAENKGIGTTWYKVTFQQFKNFIEDYEPNLFVKYTALTNQFECLDINQMYCSAIYDDELFICETDGQPIVVGTDAEVDPETAFEDYTPEELHAYIEDAKNSTLTKYITYREFNQDLLEDDRIEAAVEALQSGHYSIEDLIKDYNEIW